MSAVLFECNRPDMRNRRVAFIFLAAGVLVVAAYLLSEGREGRVERSAERAAFAVAHPGSEATLVTLDVDGMSCPDCAKNGHCSESRAAPGGDSSCGSGFSRHPSDRLL